MDQNPFKRLAERLDALPNGFPATEDGTELQLLAKLFTAEEADLAAQLRLTKETPAEIADRVGDDPRILSRHLKAMARRGLIAWGKSDRGLVYGLLPFVVGIYEMQSSTIDEELARLFEDYYQQVFRQELQIQPQVHRVIPVGESVRAGMEIRPHENAIEIVNQARAWGVVDCICRTQKALIGDPCDHPRDVCMVFSNRPGFFEGSPDIRALSQTEALDTLRRAADAGLVHSVSNNQQGLWYICNCCTCSCAILRGIAELGMVNVIARSAFVNQVDEALCLACGDCIDRCQFNALTLEAIVQINLLRCTGCGVCVMSCPENALSLVRRPEDEILPTPRTSVDWGLERAGTRGLDITTVL